MFAKSVIALAAVASFAVAAPIEQRGAPAGWAYGYLEDYDTYHVRYLALKCQNKHNTDFFQDCCRPMLSTENLNDNRKAECRPSKEATEFVVSSLSAKAAGYSATPTGAAAASSTEDCDEETSAAPSAAATTSAGAAKQAAPSSASSASAAATTSPAAEKYIAPAPSSSTTTTQAATTQAPQTTQAAATTQAPSTNNASHNGGYATFFYQGGNAGACGTVHGDYDMIVAIDHEQWGDQSFSSGSNTCGRWLTVCNNNNNKCVSAMVADVCPTCANGNSLDLSVGAFRAIASESEGMVPIRWSWN